MFASAVYAVCLHHQLWKICFPLQNNQSNDKAICVARPEPSISGLWCGSLFFFFIFYFFWLKEKLFLDQCESHENIFCVTIWGPKSNYCLFFLPSSDDVARHFSSCLVLSGDRLSADLCWPWGAHAPCSWRWPPLPSARTRTRTLTGRGMIPTWRSVSSLRWLIVAIEWASAPIVTSVGLGLAFLSPTLHLPELFCQTSGCLKPRGKISWTLSRIWWSWTTSISSTRLSTSCSKGFSR